MSVTDAERLAEIAALAAVEHCRTVAPDATMADLAAYVHGHTMGHLLTAWQASPSAAVREAAEALNEAVGSRATREALHAALCRTLPLEALNEAVGSRATREALHAALCRTLPLRDRQAAIDAARTQRTVPPRQLNA